jgi:hypothetical protein
MSIYAMRKGTSPDPTIQATVPHADNNVNYDCPTNPLFIDTATLSDSFRMFTYVSTDDSHSETFIQQLQGSDASGTQYNNLSNTEGYKIKCYDDLSATGIRLNTITLNTHDYYVLIHSDNGLTHHMARITEVKTDDIAGDSFEFSPRLGKQIPKDSKFMVFKGAAVGTTSIVAVSVGILATEITTTSTYRMNKSLICAPPLFYFYNDRLDKKNELDHDTKYYIKYDADNLVADGTINSFATNCFITTPDFNLRITDYSKFTMKANLVDNLRELDDPKIAVVSNEGLTVPTTDFTDYDDCFYNIRRDDNDLINPISLLTLTGPYRYVSYNYSPAKCNDAPNLIDVSVFESVGGRGGYAEAKVVDVLRIMPSKVKEFDAFRVRHQLHRGHFNEFFPLKATVNALVTGTRYLFNTDYDLTTLLAVGDEVLVGDKILTITTLYSFDSAALTQGIAFGTYYRLETQSVFTTSYTLSADDRLYRRAWSQSKGTLLTTFPIIENRNTNMKILIINPNYEMLEATVTGSNVAQKTLTLSFDNVGYAATSALDHVTGDYILEIERFEGEVEQIDTEREYGQNHMKLFGRDNYSKLISPSINQNTLFSQDIIYSSDSPHNTLIVIGGSTTVAFNTEVIPNSTFTNSVADGDKLFIKYSNDVVAYLGIVDSFVASTSITLKEKPLAGGTGVLWKSNDKHYMFNKALSSNNRLTNFPTSLTGSADKGLFFESGIDTSDSSTLVATSLVTAKEKSVGYHIHHPSSLKNDELFEARLSDGDATFATFDTVNTLMDFTVLNVSTTDGKTTVEIAPYIPLTLGRLDYNDADDYDNTLSKKGTTIESLTTHSVNRRYFKMDFTSVSYITTISEGDAVYIANEFVGYCTQVVKYSDTHASNANWRIYLDRSVICANGADVSIASKDTHDLYFTNGEHLHGGKYVGLVHPVLANGSPTFFNAPSNQTITTSIEKYGLPLYKLNHIEKGNFNYSPKKVYSGLKNFYNNISNIGYYSSAYRTNHGKAGIVTARQTETSHEHLAIENRGYEPASGSLYFDYNIFESGHVRDNIYIDSTPSNRYLAKDILGQYDGSCARLFLFATSDLMPYSSSRTDSLFNSNRDLTKFNLLLLNEPSKDDYSISQSQYKGSGSAKKYLDSSYQSASILEVDTPDLTKLKRMSLMRLTEVVFDCAFNQFNPEKPPKKNSEISQMVYYSYTYTDKAVTVSSYGSNEISFSGSITLANNDILAVGSANDTHVTTGGEELHLIGQVTSSGGGVGAGPFTLTGEPIPHKTTGLAAVGRLYVVTPIASTISGHGKKDSFATFNSNINLLKGLTHADTYTHADITSAFGSTFPTPEGITHAQKIDGTTNTSDGIITGLASTSLLQAGMKVSGTGIGAGAVINSVDSATQITISVVPSIAATSNLTFYSYTISSWAESNLVWPISFSAISPTGIGHTSKLIEQLFALPSATFPILTTAQTNAYAFLEHGIHGVFLDNYSVEGGEIKIDSGTAFPPLAKTHYREYPTSRVTINSAVSQQISSSVIPVRPSYYSTPSGATVTTPTANDADGVMMGFKLRVRLNTLWQTTTTSVGGTTLYKYTIVSSAPNYDAPYLDFIKDLTGTYFVSEVGKEFGTNTIPVVSLSDSSGINNIRPTSIGYVLSHEIDTSNSIKKHIIITDTNLPTGDYRVMQPNETTFYDFTPKDIKISTLSSEYTKMAYENKMYSTINDYLLIETSGDRTIGSVRNHGHNEGVLSMYVGVDLDALAPTGTTPTTIVKRGDEIDTYWNTDDTIPYEENKTVCLSDGNVTKKTTLSVNSGLVGSVASGLRFTFGDMKEMRGVVSMSETMTIITNQNIKGNPKRALIGSVVSICNEADTLVNNLFEENDIEFTTDYTEDYPLFLAPNFRGVDLFSAINYIINHKEKELVFEDSKFSLTDKKSSASDSKLLITDRNEKYQIKDFNKSDVLFDFYNEVIVFGASHKATKQNVRSIKKRGRKTLEYDDNNLATLESVETQAGNLLKLHSTLNQKVTLEIGHQGLSQLRAGDVITLELLQENLQIAPYMILEMKHEIGGFIRMELGRYSKGLEDRFAEILAEGKKTRAMLRPKTIANNISNVFIDIPKINEVQLLIRKRTATGGSSFTIGFSTVIGFVTAMGFGTTGSTTTLTTILEVDL